MGYLLEDGGEGRGGNGEHPNSCSGSLPYLATSCPSSGTGWRQVKENAETHHSGVIRKHRDASGGVLAEH